MTTFWLCAAVTAISALVSLGFSIQAVASRAAQNTAPGYALARSAALAIVAVVALFVGSIPFLVAIAIAMVIVQAADAVVGATIPNRLKTVGPAITAVVNLATLILLAATHG